MPFVEMLKIAMLVISVISLPASAIFYLIRDRWLKMERSVSTHETRLDKSDIRFEDVDKTTVEKLHEVQLKIAKLQSEKISQEQMDRAIANVKESIKTEISDVKVLMKEDKTDRIRSEDNTKEFHRQILNRLDNIKS